MEVSHLDIALLLTPSMSASSVWVSSFFSRKVFIVMPVTYVSIYVTLLYEIIIIRRDKYHNLRCVEKHPAENWQGDEKAIFNYQFDKSSFTICCFCFSILLSIAEFCCVNKRKYIGYFFESTSHKIQIKPNTRKPSGKIGK